MSTTTVPATIDTEPAPVDPRRAAYIDGLRQIADWLEQHPDVPLPYLGFAGSTKLQAQNVPAVPIYVWDDQRQRMAAIARAMGGAEKDAAGDRFRLTRHFAGIAVVASAERDQVCERIVVGTREVTEEVPDPEALAAVPKVTVTKTVEDVEWRCGSLLAPAGTEADQ